MQTRFEDNYSNHSPATAPEMLVGISSPPRNLPIFDLTPEALYAGSRTSNVMLPRDIAARRAKNAVAEFPDNPDDLWEIKMRPKMGTFLW